MQTRFSGSAFGASSVFSLRRTFFSFIWTINVLWKRRFESGLSSRWDDFSSLFLSLSIYNLLSFFLSVFLSLLLCLSPFIFFLSYSYSDFLSLSDKVSFLGMSLLLSLSVPSLSLSICLSLLLSLSFSAIFPQSHNSMPSGIS